MKHSATFLFLQFLAVIISSAAGSQFPALDKIIPQVSSDIQKLAVEALLGRLFNGNLLLINQFRIDITGYENDTQHDFYKIEYSSASSPFSIIEITASTGVAASKGIHTYLRSYTHSHFSWDGNVINLPDVMPPVLQTIKETSIGRFRYFGNVCTFSYSMVWWNWEKWEQFIDWMALNGINLPLSHVGAESVWQNIYRKLGLSQSEIDQHFTGPAFLAWYRMGNLYRWGGPLSQEWHKSQQVLQQRILSRMTSLGMIPVLQGFAGHVPVALIKKYPTAKISRSSCWVFGHDLNYTCVPYLQPNDPLFQHIASLYMQELKEIYGHYHVYSADPFNEMSPQSYDTQYLQSTANNILAGMTNTDPYSVWVMQGWMFVGGSWNKTSAKTLLTAVPKGRILVLDLYSEVSPIYDRFDSYFGQPFVWNFLHNFGGINIMYGSFDSINKGLSKAVNFAGSNLVGTGLTMEGIYQNYALYQFMLDRSWTLHQINLDSWLAQYVNERYSNIKAEARNLLVPAWISLKNTVYGLTRASLLSMSPLASGKHLPVPGQMILKRPHLGVLCEVPFDKIELNRALDLFISALSKITSEDYEQSETLMIDYKSVSAVAININLCMQYQSISQAYATNNTVVFDGIASSFLTNLHLMDQSYASCQRTNLSFWLQEARDNGCSGLESLQYATNWRYQLSLWGPEGQILDYARKQWGGMLREYYIPRWLLFFQFLTKAMLTGNKFSQKTFDHTVYNTVEKRFCTHD